MKTLCIFLVLVVAVAAFPPPIAPHDCPANKEFGTFGDCPPSCLKNPPKFCTKRLGFGCKCKEGYVLTKYKDHNSDCVKPEDCPQ
ncbi:hypothetical protein AVEN_193746-1 [Araneus ventricosus]|uniref:TIL domain-containing protein n=1 Tax=Araneus ventricosus TaxID=182803 RepID=A0A4Y2DKW7_ARAVE|nr:hypothetical protein AVEN_193746-1 [Araneus ventricosus]